MTSRLSASKALAEIFLRQRLTAAEVGQETASSVCSCLCALLDTEPELVTMARSQLRT